MFPFKPSLVVTAVLIVTVLIVTVLVVTASPLGAQIAVDDDNGFIANYSTTTYRAPDPFTSGVYLGPSSDDAKSNPRRPWEPLSFQDSTFRLLRPLPVPLARTFTAHPSRSHLQPHGSQSFDIITSTPPVFPEPSHYDSSRGSAEPSYAPTNSDRWSEESVSPENETVRPRAVAKPPVASVPKRSVTASEPGRLTFSVLPADTRILVNDDLLGTGESLGIGQPKSFKPGVYAIEAEHGQYTTERLMFSLGSGEVAHVVIDLSAEVGDRGRVDKSKPRSR